MTTQLISAPTSTDRATIEPLGYLQSRDEVINQDYACAVWKETNPETGKWMLNIKATATANTRLDPDHSSVRTNMAKAAISGRMHSVFGFNLTPSPGDSRLVENRLHFDENLRPQTVSLHLVTRNADGSPKAEQSIEFPWPGAPRAEEQVVHAPNSTDRLQVTQLAYLNAYDPFVDTDYAYVVYTERKTDTGSWIFKISARSTAGAQLDPAHPSFKAVINKAASLGKDHVIFGFQLQPSEKDPRKVENRLYFDDQKQPTRVEIEVITRKIDGSAAPARIATIPWPSS